MSVGLKGTYNESKQGSTTSTTILKTVSTKRKHNMLTNLKCAKVHSVSDLFHDHIKQI